MGNAAAPPLALPAMRGLPPRDDRRRVLHMPIQGFDEFRPRGGREDNLPHLRIAAVKLRFDLFPGRACLDVLVEGASRRSNSDCWAGVSRTSSLSHSRPTSSSRSCGDNLVILNAGIPKNGIAIWMCPESKRIYPKSGGTILISGHSGSEGYNH
jgi:hypothetical protein